MRTYYQVLELSEQATAEDIRRAYLRLVRITHPDRTPDPAAHQRYLLVNEAYDTLRQPASRARYDAQLALQRQPVAPVATPPPFPGNAFQVLRVPYAASQTQIEQAYQRLAAPLRRNTTDPALRRYLRTVEHAYAVLRDPRWRQQHYEQVRHQNVQRTALDRFRALYAGYASVARRSCRWLVLLPLLVWADYWLPGRSVLARPLLLQCYQVQGERSCFVRTTEGPFLTTIELPGGIEQYKLRISWLFRFVHAAELPSGENLPLLINQTTLASMSVILLLLCCLSQQRRLTAEGTVQVAIAAAFMAVLVLLLAIFNAYRY
ncbi:J domain-containing protein [Solirubrum puertoriconensis]|uniref:J domain-containing protein n=1 Tax=Solirubrum puertoriconensis TaxID=1751427 RepID=A0A9X0HLI2_SOLP1|nr:J domain-containing protein [Solirubrum puertoriconensis]KUG08188.1 hypothetical protein ASU33_08330 [Solirubrum puertoriconensis]